ncbi:MAG: hypothetical protein DME98_14780 [Verrucomicrobia bacterium]|nr:MAG: hypothetical protein DME98_14780 [Verrucomicrobiota bacterium]
MIERERENFNHSLFAFAFFSQRQDRELLGAISRGLLTPSSDPSPARSSRRIWRIAGETISEFMR